MTNDIVVQNREIISVGELNRSAKYLLENNFSNVSVLGEISNLASPSSGHLYFTLKDEDGAIRCAMFKNQNQKLNFVPKNGDKCILVGQVSIYAQRGDYQIIVKSLEQSGFGNLMQKFEALRNKLDHEGLFDKNIKLEIPTSPKHTCIVTSSSTAAFQDIISTVNRRAPNSQISLSEAMVQGDNAHISIINALNRVINFNENNPSNIIDLVVLSRGGGSIEDLWCFNNEELAREIFSFPIPIISAVGHEIDFTICDFVADIRVPTPTASAELITEHNFKLFDNLVMLKNNIIKNFERYLSQMSQSIEFSRSRLKSPSALLREKSQRLDNYDLRLQKERIAIISRKTNLIESFKSAIDYHNPILKVNKNSDQLDSLFNNLQKLIKAKVKSTKKEIYKYHKNLEILSPLSILERGYSILMSNNGVAIKSSNEVKQGEKLSAKLSKGSISIEVKEKHE